MSLWRQCWALRGPLVLLFLLIVLLPLVLSDDPASRCAYVVLVMAGMWLTEAIPISATALMPIFMFPLCGVQPASQVSKAYIGDTSMLFLGGLIVAVAVEECGLHKRIAIGVLRIVGADPKFVMLGVLLPTWFLSMWISNTATASMMIPIANAVVTQMGDVRKDIDVDGVPMADSGTVNASPAVIPATANNDKPTTGSSNNTADKYTYIGDTMERQNSSSSVENFTEFQGQQRGPVAQGSLYTAPDMETSIQTPTDSVMDAVPGVMTESKQEVRGGSDEHSLLCKGIALCVAYGCNIGGIATLTGTPPNLVFKGVADKVFNARYKALGLPEDGSGITFANWMGMALPMSAITLLLAWVLLMAGFLRTRVFQKVPADVKSRVKAVILDEWRDLGKMSLAEVEVALLFVLLAVMWISRDPKETPGWASWFMKGYVSDSSAVMLIVLLLFLLPAEVPRVFALRSPEHADSPYYRPLLNWKQVNKKLPWGVIILLGGGFALAGACSESGLSDWLADELRGLSALEPWVLNLVLCLVVACATEVTSNTATSTLLMPIMFNIAISIGVNPLYLMASAAMATSFAFMLPVATPPNAIVFSYGYLRVFDMALIGLFMNVVAILCLTLAVNTWGSAIFDFGSLPVIFLNSTSAQ